jgi:WS/DGAT/MGAT family acyltransferase
MRKLNFLDVGFLLGETRETPMHVGGVSLYSLPEGADERTFLQDLADTLRNVDEFQVPYGDRLKTGRLGLAGSVYWEPDPAIDIDYHIRHSALPQPGRYRELFNLVSRLHATLLDRQRPLWEMHLIEGLQNRQFATYNKTHHAAVDGARSVHLARSMLSDNPEDRLRDSPMSLAVGERYRARLQREHPAAVSDQELRNVVEVLKARFDTTANIYGALKTVTAAWRGKGGGLTLPFMDVPQSSINTSVDGARRFVAQSWPFARIRAIGKAFDGTFNDAVLAMCAGALRLYLQNHGELPEKSLKAMVPVSLRRAGDIDSSNAVAAISADLATNIEDPAERIAAIQASTRAGKAYFLEMSPTEAQLFSTVMQLPGMLLVPLGLASRLPPFNTIISNVPGMSEPMYWNGARLEGSYPASIVTEGVALNITLVTYDQNVDFGIMACRRSIPQAQRLIDYMEQSLVELEDAAGLSKPKAKRGGKRKAPVKKKAPAKKKVPTRARRAKKPGK